VRTLKGGWVASNKKLPRGQGGGCEGNRNRGEIVCPGRNLVFWRGSKKKGVCPKTPVSGVKEGRPETASITQLVSEDHALPSCLVRWTRHPETRVNVKKKRTGVGFCDRGGRKVQHEFRGCPLEIRGGVVDDKKTCGKNQKEVGGLR